MGRHCVGQRILLLMGQVFLAVGLEQPVVGCLSWPAVGWSCGRVAERRHFASVAGNVRDVSVASALRSLPAGKSLKDEKPLAEHSKGPCWNLAVEDGEDGIKDV